MTFRLNTVSPWWLMTGGLAVLLTVGRLGTTWARNQSSLRFSHSVSFHRAEGDLDGLLYLQHDLSPDGFLGAEIDPCQSLWYSRLTASLNMERAGKITANAQHCPRSTLVDLWAGQLAWRAGNRGAAMSHWGTLPPSTLVTWGRNLVLAGDVGLGKAVLLTAGGQHPEQTLDPGLQALLYQTLGDVHRQEGDLERAIIYYGKAWRASGYSYGNTAYQLGAAYVSLGDCNEAIDVWETALRRKPKREFPFLDFSYLVSLAGCHVELNDFSRARFFLDAGQNAIDAQRTSISAEANARLQDRLDSVRETLQANSNP